MYATAIRQSRHQETLITIRVVTVTIQPYFNIIDYIPYAVVFNSMAYLFYNWQFAPRMDEIVQLLGPCGILLYQNLSPNNFFF